MGLSASQARKLSLVARQSNLEYQGQQVNQERTILSQQSTTLYNSLLSMTVPTPPSTSDYTTVQYTGTNGATTYSFDASAVKPGTNGSYCVTLGTTAYGASLTQNTGYVSTTKSYETITGEWVSASYGTTTDNEDETPTTNTISADAISNYYVYESSGVVRQATASDFEQTETGDYKLKSGVQYFWANGTGTDTASLSGTETTLVAGKTAYTLAEALEEGVINQTEYEGYINAINNAGITMSSGSVCTADDFYLYVDDNGSIHFALISDVEDNSGAAVTYDYIANGAYTQNTEYDYTELEFDVSTGRIVSMTIPTTYDENGEPLTYITIDLEAETVTDEAAYQDAYNQYEYEQYLYDKQQAEINAKTEIIQQEDKNLELKLERLDDERTQITTEIEAIDKVIEDNIESSYKTFSG